ncbi:substrate-binding domain-containing protein [Burkholderiaceae bacterium DAT-1]|nr:substrate-binding domain-containing protein [Burkholderiaceae bacterium DAT-1]
MFKGHCACLLICLSALPAFAASPTRPAITLIVKSRLNAYFKDMMAVAEAHARSHANEYSLKIRGVPWETDLELQKQQLEQALQDRPDAIVIAPIDTSALVPLLKKAIKQGIIVIDIDNKLDDQALAQAGIQIPFVGPSNRAGTRLAGEYVARQLRPDDEVAIMEGVVSAVNSQSRTAGYEDAMQTQGMRIVAQPSGEWEIAPAEKVASELISAHPKLKAILCDNDNMAIGTVQALRKAGKIGKILVTGYDHTLQIRPYIERGEVLATVDQFGGQQAVAGIELALRSLKQRIPQNSLPAIQQTPVKLVTRDAAK